MWLFLLLLVQEADEILYMFAEQLVKFVDLVGGVEHATALVLPLQNLLGIDETFVRNSVSAFLIEKEFSSDY